LNRIFITTFEQSTSQGKISYSGIFNPNREKNFVDMSEHPGVERHASFVCINNHEITFDNQTCNVNLLAIDTNFLQILDYSVIAGANNVRRPEDAFITETYAAKIFGKENPIGKTLFYPTINKSMTIAGIIRPPASKSLLSFDMLVSSGLNQIWSTPQSLILLYPGVDYRDVNRRYSDFMEMSIWGYGIRYQLFPYKDVYFNKVVGAFGRLGQLTHGNLAYIFILIGIGILLLIIGLTNYVNIQSVVMTRRNKELGMKKVFGASGGRILVQLLVENILLIVVSLIIAFWFAATLHPFVENSFDIKQYPNLRFDIYLAFALLAALPVAVSIAPYLRYRYFSPIRSLHMVNAGGKSLFSHKFFLCFQYFITIVLIAVSLFFVKQLNFMLDKDLGFRTQNMIKVPFLKEYYGSINMSDDELAAKWRKEEETVDVLKQKMSASTLIECWSFGDFPINYSNWLDKVTVAGKETGCRIFGVDETWFKLFDIQLLDGRVWDNEIDHFNGFWYGKSVIFSIFAIIFSGISYYVIISSGLMLNN
jgi:ABC-type antimicrobial peptide transport system permease subunit